jgi:hypothetical protein
MQQSFSEWLEEQRRRASDIEFEEFDELERAWLLQYGEDARPLVRIIRTFWSDGRALRRICDLKSMPYRDYLQTDHWKEVRAQMLKRAGHKCSLCGSRERLNVHHNNYQSLGDERWEDLAVLCRPCHGKFHDKLGD